MDASGSSRFGESMNFLDLTLPDIAANLALDEALLVAAEERGAGLSLRLWEAGRPAIVMGASGRRLDDVKLDECTTDGVAIARRASGGGTVVVGPGALNVSVVLSAHSAPGLGAVDVAHRYVLDRLADALRVHVAGIEVLGLGDLTLGLRKFAGSAQRRLRDHFLVHTTILYDFPLELVARYTRLPARRPAYRGDRSHDDFLMNLPLPRRTLIESVVAAWLPPGHDGPPAHVPHDLVDRLVADKFGDPGWIERL